ncbi:hypothetical protein BJ912DRAFT_971689 [Pholiota molesta]|nr:hypothetical protein BJ912DRAFT_971689 [Pholiota molesta]
MVLQNTRQRTSPKTRTRPLLLHSSQRLVSKIYEDASSRGRTRSTKRARRKAKARGSVRLTVPTPPTAVDVEMTPICLQSELLRPHYKEVSLENIRDVEPVLEDLSLKTIRLGSRRLLHNQLPKEMLVHAPENGDCLPTHMLAVYAPPPPNGESSAAPRKVTLFPVHSLVLLAHCANICKPPAAIPAPCARVLPTTLDYLYTKQVHFLLRSFLPGPPPRDLMTNPMRPRGYALYLAQTFTTPAMLKCIYSLEGLWQNVCQLGVYDDNLWEAMDVMWQTLLTALAIASGNPSLMLPHPNPSASRPAISPMNVSP